MRYRDSKSGRFVSKSTWTRSKSHGGLRYVRQGVKKSTPRRKKKQILPTPPLFKLKKARIKKAKTAGKYEYVLKFSYKSRFHSIFVEVHLFGPLATKDEVKEVYEEWFTTGSAPKGWEVQAINWASRPQGNKTQTQPPCPYHRYRSIETTTKEAREDLWFVLTTPIESVDTTQRD